MDFELFFEQKSKMAELLLACPSFSNRAKRDSTLSQMRGGQVMQKATRNDADNVDVINLLDRILITPRAFEELLSIISYFDGDVFPVQNLKSYYQSLLVTPSLLDGPEQQKLVALIEQAGLEAAALKTIFTKSKPEDRSEEASDAKRAVEVLADMDKPAWLLGFVERVRTQAQTTWAKVKLRDWAEKFAEQKNCKPEFAALRHEIEAEQQNLKKVSGSSTAYLLIRVSPEQVGDEFMLTAWVWPAGSNEPTPVGLSDPDKKYKLDTVEEALDELLFEFKERTFGTDQRIVEFLLPFNLLLDDKYAVEWWDFDKEHEVALIERTPVVVRWADRFSKRDYRAALRDRWETLGQLEAQRTVSWLHDLTDYDWEAIRNQLQDKQVFFAVMTRPPDRVRSKKGTQHILDAIRVEGTPVTLWCRTCSFDAETLRQKLEELLNEAAQEFWRLPELVQQQRLKACDEDTLVPHGKYLTLLWDDPRRLPPDVGVANQLKGF